MKIKKKKNYDYMYNIFTYIIIIFFIFIFSKNQYNYYLKNINKIHKVKIHKVKKNTNDKKIKFLTLKLKKIQNKNLEGINDKQMIKYIINISKKNNISPFLIFSIIKIESNFRFNVTSYTNAKGLMQIEPLTYKIIRNNYNVYTNSLFNPYSNILIGVMYFKRLLKYFHYNVNESLCAYNEGKTKVKIYNIQNTVYSIKVLNYYKKLKKEYIYNFIKRS